MKPRKISSSKSRYEGYHAKRRAAHREERIADRTDRRDAALKQGAKRGYGTLIRAFYVFLRGSRRRLGVCLLLLTLATILGLAVPYATKIAIDYALTDQPGPAGLPAWVESFSVDRAVLAEGIGGRLSILGVVAGAVLVISVLAETIGLVGRAWTTGITKRLQVTLRRKAFDHAVRLPLHRISDIKSGGVASILREDAGNAGELLFSMIYNPFRAVIQLAGTLAILALLDWRLVLGALLLLPLVYLSHKTWIARIRPVYKDIRRTRQTIDAQAAESFGGIRVVRGFHRGEAEKARFSRDNHFMARQELLAWWWSRLVELVWQVLIPLASGMLLFFGGWFVLSATQAAGPGETPAFTVGDLMAFSGYLLMLLGPVEALVASAANIQSQLAGLDRTLDLLEEDKEFEAGDRRADADVEPPFVLTRANTAGRLALQDVSFRYPERVSRAAPEDQEDEEAARDAEAEAARDGSRPYVLEGITLDIPAGSTLALVGPSGSGKTTLTNLLARFYDPTHGRVTLDGRDLRSVDVDSYRRLLGIVEQDVFLFDGTVAENIGYARRTATAQDVVRAAEAANAHGFIEGLESGYDTLIGERGVRLSGGQKQRLAIARAILADPAILILDEATSNLDSESERLIQQSLSQLMKSRTSVVIAHRLSTIRHANTIAVLENGRLIERGTHDELTAAGGRYADLLKLQLAGAEQGRPVD